MKRIDGAGSDEPSARISLKAGRRPFGVELQHLLAFMAIYEERQVTLAARRLGRSQSALSHSLARLRTLLDDELFTLRNGEMWPTLAAQRIFPTVRRAIELIDSLQHDQGHFDPQQDVLHLRIGMTDYEEKVISPRLWAALEQRAPGTRLIARSINRYAAESLLLSGALDLALVGNPVHGDPLVECTTLFEDPYVVACSAHHYPDGLDLASYLAAPHLSVAVGGEEFGAVDAALQRLGYRREVRCVMPTYLRTPAMLSQSKLVATLARKVFILDETGAPAASLHLQPPPFALEPVRICMLSLRGERCSAAQRWVRELIEELFAVAGPGRAAPGTPSGQRL